MGAMSDDCTDWRVGEDSEVEGEGPGVCGRRKVVVHSSSIRLL